MFRSIAQGTLSIVSLAAALLVQPTSARADAAQQPLEVVDHVDLERYMGTWYEIASIPQRFQEGCVASEAQYRLRSDGRVDVVNSCRLGSFDGERKTARGVAWVTDRATNAKLKVRFFWPFAGAYWIIELGDDYEYAVVGHPEREYLWILARDRHLDAELYARLMERIVSVHGYDGTRIVRSLQPVD